jgi:bleomycin hydrolase
MHYKLNILLFVFLIGYCLTIHSQESTDFKIIKQLKATPVKNQSNTGTCWSFGTISFLESELLRMGKGEFDLSEMFIIHRNYHERAIDYVRFHGNQKFSGGAEGWDVLNVIRKYGLVPENVFSGLNYGLNYHNHTELDAVLLGYMNALVKLKKEPLTPVWPNGVDGILDAYLGKIPEKFTYNAKEYTPVSFLKESGLNPDDYITIGSFSHHPFYQEFVFEGPDNWAYGKIQNVPIDEFVEICDYSILNGYTFAWCSDVSNDGFSSSAGVADISDDDLKEFESAYKMAVELKKEVTPNSENNSKIRKTNRISQGLRQMLFDNHSTTEDHLMHITGMASGKDGKKYYLVKNSWGAEQSIYEGYLYASEDFFRLWSLSVIVHKDGIPKNIAKKMKL